MPVLITPITVGIRIYPDTVVIDLGKPLREQYVEYTAYCTAEILDNGIARIQGLNGSSNVITRQNYKAIKQALRDYGANVLTYRRGVKEVTIKL